MSLYYQILTIYERTSLIGSRAEQITRGATSTLSADEMAGTKNAIEIAERELNLKKIPLHVVRRMPSGVNVELDPNDMSVIGEYTE